MTARKIDIKDCCESLYSELINMKAKLNDFVVLMNQMEGEQKKALFPYEKHLHEMISFIDWKIEIFSKICPVDLTRVGQEFESTVSVPPVDLKEGEHPAGGYVGG